MASFSSHESHSFGASETGVPDNPAYGALAADVSHECCG
ncbi:hypothetical protein XSR1_70066 [Xenorhabdus szentirmaii DSM 16338]|uniref:Uncharacterized protein n=1 Tax=Xenorhabdus szentirmaii DSM 16338 TaxID=1427518 RepID=W1J637_9GAMM|nr:hypothetical protein XSR1_70066 [Xenorhabdus szentirmaii DSM 16338]